MPTTDSLVVQIGKEGGWGTKATKTIKLAGVSDASIQPAVETRVIATSRGGFAPGSGAAIMSVAADGRVTQEALYEDIVYWLDSMFGSATPSGAGPYTRTYTAPTSTAPTPVSWTVYNGESDGYDLEGGVVTGFTLSGSVGDTVTMAVTLTGESVTAGTPAVIADRTVNPLMMHHLDGIWIDTWAGTIGTTAITNTVYGFELVVDLPRPTRRYAGQTTAAALLSRKWSGTLRLDMDYNAVTKALMDAIVGAAAPVQRQIRLKFSDTAARDFQIDFGGVVVDNPAAFEEDNDIATLPMTFQGMYHATLATWLKFIAINSIATV